MITHAHTRYIKQSSAIVCAIPYCNKENVSLCHCECNRIDINAFIPNFQNSWYGPRNWFVIALFLYLQNHEFTLDEVISCLTELEVLCTDRKEYDNLCFLLTLPSITADKAYKNWNPSSARISCFNQVGYLQFALLCVFWCFISTYKELREIKGFGISLS